MHWPRRSSGLCSRVTDGPTGAKWRPELPDRLASDGVTFDVSDLDQALTRLEDCGRIIRTQRQPFSISTRITPVF
jgi:hypothetical protein